MSCAALTPGGTDSIHSCQKTIDSGTTMKSMVTTCRIRPDGVGREDEDLMLNSPFDHCLVTGATTEGYSTSDRHAFIPGGFA